LLKIEAANNYSLTIDQRFPAFFWPGATFILLEGVRGHKEILNLADTIYMKEWRIHDYFSL